MDAAVFRPAQRSFLPALLAGAAGGFVIGLMAGIPPLAGAAMGAAAAAIAVGIRNASAPRLVATERGVAARGDGSGLEARWDELRLGFGSSAGQRYAILADPRGRSFAFADLGGARAPPVRGADGRAVPVTDLRDAPLLLALVVQRAGAWHVLPAVLQQPPVNEPAPAPARPRTSACGA